MAGTRGLNTLKVQKYYKKIDKRRRANKKREKKVIKKLEELVKDE